MSWTFPARPQEIASARRKASSFVRAAGVADPPLAAMQLAISEAVTNSVLHAFRDRADPGTVVLAIDLDDAAWVEVVVRDDGMGLSPRDDSPGLGLGLGLIERMADRTDFRPGDGRTGFELRMHFRR